MTWATAVDDLRVILSDGPTDKLRAIKEVVGNFNGINQTFKTFEFRRITDFSASGTASPLGVSINGVLQAPSAFSIDDPSTGFYTLAAASAVTDADQMRATYYIQWFLDAELNGFLVRAANWLGMDDDYSLVPSGLKTAALKYASHEAYQKLALKYAENIAETYRFQDTKDEKRFTIVEAYQKAARENLKEAETYRDDFYTRKGRAKAPIWRSVVGRVRDIPPKG